MHVWHTTTSNTGDDGPLNENEIPLLNTSAVASHGASRDQATSRGIKRKPVPSSSSVSPVFINASEVRHSPHKTDSLYSRLVDENPRNVTGTEGEGRDSTGYEAHHSHADRKGNLQAYEPRCNWLPYTLRWPYLSALLLFTLAILAVIISLHIDSHKSHGLADDDNRSVQFFGWRFTPTLIAVLYALMCTMLLEDVKRTELFSRLAKPGGADSVDAVLQEPGAWWNAMFDGFSLRKNQGSRSWVLVYSVSCMILASLVISPLSSALLVSDEVTILVDSDFEQVQPSQRAPLGFGDQVLPRFRSIAHLLQKVTTSAWVMDNATVLPFYPSQYPAAPLDAIVGISPETWQAETTVLTATLDCKPLQFVSKGLRNITYQSSSDNYTYEGFYILHSVNLTTDDGCLISLTPPGESFFLTYGGASWARPGVFAVSVNDVAVGVDNGYEMLLNSSNSRMDISFSEECIADEVLLISSPWVVTNSSSYSVNEDTPWNPNLQIVGQMCNASYLAATVTAGVNVTDIDTLVTYDEQDFQKKQLPVDSTVIDVERLQQDFLSPDWSYHLVVPNNPYTNPRPSSGGPAALLMAMYNFSTSDALADSSLIAQATRLKQRYLGEAIVATLSQSSLSMNTNVDGRQMSIRKRIIVIESIAIALETILFAEVLLIMGLCWLTRLARRKLQLSSDPARVVTIARLIAQDPETRQIFLHADNLKTDTSQAELERVRLTMSPDHLSVIEARDLRQKTNERGIGKMDKQSSSRAWRPTILYRRTTTGLVFLLLIVLVAIAVLLHYSQGPGLYEKAFIYSTRVVVSSKHVSTIAPYSIIPTLIAVIIGLWWGAFETALRFLQPFITMTRRPVAFQNGVSLSYRSSYQLWAGIKAALRGHWLLSTVCIGAFLSQILTIGMSALWQEEYGYRNSSVSIRRDLELRVMPISTPTEYTSSTHAITGADIAAVTLAKLYGSLQTNWLYSAIIQTTLNGSQPTWSLDGWSFVPVDLAQLSEPAEKVQNATVTVMTSAIAGHLECSPWAGLNNLSNWLTLQDFSNSSVWNVTANPTGLLEGYTLGCGGVSGVMVVQANETVGFTCDYEAYSTFFNHRAGMTCCANSTTQGTLGDAAIGYWSPTTYQEYSYGSYNFTVKWIYGQPVSGVLMNGSTAGPYLAWPEAPQAAALNCMPAVRKANATVTVDQRTGVVQSYSILDSIQNDTYAWIDDFYGNVDETVLINGYYPDNITTSHGILFTKALLAAADLENLVGDADIDEYIEPSEPGNTENLQDLTFNIRQPGLNVDYMSYSMYSLANKNATALLDPATLAYYANKTFSAFFQNFVSTNVSFTDGGYGFQPIGFKLPANNTSPAVGNLTSVPVTATTVQAQISTRVKMLHVSPVAAWLCMSILLWLVITALLYVVLEKRYLSTMRRGVATIADVLIMVAGSTAFLGHIRKHGVSNTNAAGLKTRLGWFRDQQGRERWGIELVGEEHGVEWLDGGGGGGEHGQVDDDTVESIPMVVKTKVNTHEEELEQSSDIYR